MTISQCWRWALMCMLVASGAFAQDELPYPQGKQFPLGLYSIGSAAEMQAEKPFGWNICHTYGMKPDFVQVAKEGGMFPLVHVNEGDQGAVKAQVLDLVSRGPIAWWDLPEEQRYWRADEYAIVKDYPAWIRQFDPQQRPVYMYLPGHYDAEAVSKYVPYLDIIGAGAYTEYAHMPHAWVRWRMEQTIAGIELAGGKIGPDYRHGEKTPIGIPMLFYSPDQMDVISPVEAYHDLYSCLAAGAKGILVFSYWHKRDQGMLQASYDAYAKAAREVSGPVGLGQALLFGQDVPLDCEITKGPARTWSFQPYGVAEPLTLPSVNVLGKTYQGKLYLIAVNSAEKGVQARITSLPAGVKTLSAPFEKQADAEGKPTDEVRQLPVADGAVSDEFSWLGVHVYVAELGG